MRKGHTVKGYFESKIERVCPLEHEYTLVISWQSDHIILIFAMYKWTVVFVCWSVYHFGPEQNVYTSITWIAMKCSWSLPDES